MASASVTSNLSLNESPSKKEGKYRRRGFGRALGDCLNESPSKKEGKCRERSPRTRGTIRLNESPSKKEGKFMLFEQASIVGELASMKVSARKRRNSWF